MENSHSSPTGIMEDQLWPSTSSFEQLIAVKLAAVFVTLAVILVLRICNYILEPMDYNLNMTTKKYCKRIAEISNNLQGESYTNETVNLKVSIDCATDIPDQLNNNATTYNMKTGLNNGNSVPVPADYGRSKALPNAWIPLIESYKVKPGTVKKAIIFGRDVIVTRSADGKQVDVLDAYCPHMGVHIGVGGTVKEVGNESCVECPFHGWTFRSKDGQCVKIPYQNKDSRSGIPKQAKLNVWTSMEVDNFIYIWHHIDNAPPKWTFNPLKELTSGKYILAGRSCHETNLELRDMLENGADMNHFEGIHNDIFVLGGEIIKLRQLKYLQRFVRHHWRPDWRPVLDDTGRATHMAEMRLQSWIEVFYLRLFDITVRALQIGPARVNLYYNSRWYGKGLLTMNAIPLGGRRTKYIQHIYTERNLFQCLMAKLVLMGEIKMLERDFFIWNHKKDISNPIFVPEDKTLKQFRLWYHTQFYNRKRRIVIRNEEREHDESKWVPACERLIDF